MAFPTTPIIESFTGADQDPLTSGWTATFVSGDTGRLARISNHCTNSTGGGAETSSGYDLVASPGQGNGIFGPNSEVYMTVTTKSAVNGDTFRLFARIINPASPTFSGYEVYTEVSAGTDIWRIQRRDSVTPTALGADMAQEYSAGDSIGMSVIGSTISAWYKASAGSWVVVGTRTDSTYTAAGVLGIKTTQTAPLAWQSINFGGGTAITSAPGDDPPQRILGYGSC